MAGLCYFVVFLSALVQKCLSLTCNCGTITTGSPPPQLRALAAGVSPCADDSRTCSTLNGQTCVKLGLAYMGGTLWMHRCAALGALVPDETMQLFWPGLEASQVPICGMSANAKVGSFGGGAGTSQLCHCATDKCNTFDEI